jgi:hypothetical protein
MKYNGFSCAIVANAECTHILGYSTKKIKIVSLTSLAFSEFYFYYKYEKSNILSLAPLILLRILQIFLSNGKIVEKFLSVSNLSRLIAGVVFNRREGYFK